MNPTKLVTAVFFALFSASMVVAGDRPNVLFIAVDDLKPQLGCYGRSEIHSPNIDKLARSGLRFDRAYCQVAVCGATRTSLLTGLRPDTTGVFANQIHFRTVKPDVVTLPQHFKRHGYHVEGMGKIYHQDDAASWSVPLGWPETPHLTWREAESRKVIDDRRAAYEAAAAKYKAQGKKVPAGLARRMTRGPVVEAGDVPDAAYFDGELAGMAVEALGRVAKDRKPFFLAVGFLKPHLPFVCPKRYWDLYDAESIQLASNPFPPKDVPAAALHRWEEMRTYAGVPGSGPASDELARRLVHGYYGCVSYTDAMVGRVLDELDRLDLAEETIVILWGDHGWHLGDHGLWCKHSNFESATHVPLILRVPGMKSAGKSTAALVELIDIYPTLAELAGLPVPEHAEGTSFAPLVGNPGRAWKSAAMSQYPRGTLLGCSMRTERYRLTRWVERSNREQCEAVELYDHQNDPQENVNIAGAPENARLVQQLTEQLQRGWKGARPGP